MNFKTVNFKIHKFKLSHSSPSSSNKFFVANTALNFWAKSYVLSTVLSVQHDNEQLITKSTNRLQLHCLSQCQNRSPRSPLPMFPFNGCLSVIDC